MRGYDSAAEGSCELEGGGRPRDVDVGALVLGSVLEVPLDISRRCEIDHPSGGRQ